ncbi:cation transporter [Ornatilinea apprima]|uniref:Cation transporter n=1 Tax=Ornatilinea apprima TaxID=1134406 RepID=A0A0P6WV24_9CHLR|nr:cation diffusion facilitator family transporter [Ornatilinea apprima]KPL74111.1 cation transporter [Ornatilinea apprima]
MRWIRSYTPDPTQQRLYRQALIITGVGNLTLAAGKAVAAYLTGSAALYADAANSVSDVVYSALMILGLWVAMQPPDLSHPQGHSRFEPLVGLMVTLSMTLAGYEAARTAIERFLEGGLRVELGLPAIVLLIAAGIKAWMYVSVARLARQLHSPTLETTARDNLSDVLTSSAAFIGAAGSQFIHPLADPIAGLIVAIWIFRNAFLAGRENLNFLTGAGADEELRQEIVRKVESVEGVQRVHFMVTEYVGPKLVVDVHANVDGSMSLDAAHEINDQVIELLEDMAEVDRAYVHLEPEHED